MANNGVIKYVIKKDDKYATLSGGFTDFNKASMLNKETAEKLLKYYPGKIVKVRIKEVDKEGARG